MPLEGGFSVFGSSASYFPYTIRKDDVDIGALSTIHDI